MKRRKKMSALQIIVCFLSMVHVSDSQGDDDSCSGSWFGHGPKPRHRCHCLDYKCDSITGHCPGGCCNTSFDKSCHVWDQWSYGKPSDPKLTWLFDHDDTTCNPSQLYKSSFNVTLRKGSKFTWMRLVLHDTDVLEDIHIHAINGLPLDRADRTLIDGYTVDIFFAAPILIMTQFMFTGIGITALCTVYITVGIDLPRHRRVTMSSNTARAPLAVDMNRAKEPASICAVSRISTNPRLDVYFDPPVMWFWLYVRIVTSRDYYTKMYPLSIEPIDPAGKILTSIRRTNFGSLITLYMSEAQVTSRMGFIARGRKRRIAICEIDLYGYPVCPDETWGVDCENECLCEDPAQPCHINGGCMLPCPHGKFGYYCNQPCNSRCRGGCNQLSGQCVRCQPGRKGFYCHEECEPRSYGLMCNEVCPEGCKNGLCNKVTGICDECYDGFFGIFCSLRCWAGCEQVGCQRETGACSNCPSPQGFYSRDCTPCPEHCHADVTCHPISGECGKCEEGFYGPHCDLRQPQ